MQSTQGLNPLQNGNATAFLQHTVLLKLFFVNAKELREQPVPPTLK